MRYETGLFLTIAALFVAFLTLGATYAVVIHG